MSDDRVKASVQCFNAATCNMINASERSHTEASRLQYDARNLRIAKRRPQTTSSSIDTKKLRRPNA